MESMSKSNPPSNMQDATELQGVRHSTVDQVADAAQPAVERPQQERIKQWTSWRAQQCRGASNGREG
jgi:hypothetical protein